MTGQHSDDLIRAFVAEGRDELPDRAFDAARGEIHRTRQRVVIGPWREPQMSNLAKVALAAAAVIAVAFGASRLLPSTSGPGASPSPPTPTSSPTPSLSQTATPTESAAPSVAFISPGPICDPQGPSGALEAGTYSVSETRATLVPYTVEVPAGWFLQGGCIIANNTSDTNSDVLFMTWNVSHVFPDACQWDETNVLPAGTTAAELTDVLRSQLGRVASATTDVEVGGFAGKRTEFTVAPGIDQSTCSGGPPGYVRLWPDAGPNFDGGFCCSPKDSTDDMRIVDVDGQRVVVIIERLAGASPEDVAAAESIVDSIAFDTTRAASPAP